MLHWIESLRFLRHALFLAAFAAMPIPSMVADEPAGPETIALPGPADTVCVGGAGRFLLVAVPTKKVVAVLDAKERKVVKQWPVAEKEFCIAAGKDHAYILLTESRVLQRYSLATLARDWSKPSPVQGPVDSLTMGSASTGPLGVTGAWRAPEFDRGNLLFLDPETLLTATPVQTPEDERRGYMPPLPRCWPGSLRVSPDGRHFTWNDSFGYNGHGKTHVADLAGGHYRFRSGNSLGGQFVFPTDGAKYLLSPQGAYDGEFKRQNPHGNTIATGILLPATTGPLAMVLRQNGPVQNPAFRNGNDGPLLINGTATIQLASDDRPLGVVENLPRVEVDNGSWRSTQGKLSYDMRHSLLPDHGLLVSLVGENDRLAFIPFNLDKLLDTCQHNYLFIASDPPSLVERGKPFAYAPQVKSKAGGVVLKLNSGPPGMTLDNGSIKWTPTTDLAEADATIVLSISDKAGMEQFHTLRVRLFGGKPAAKKP